MKPVISFCLILTFFLASSGVLAKGDYSIEIQTVTEQRYAVVLVSSYSNYYNEILENTFASKRSAQQAGEAALKKLLDSGVDAEPEHCWYDVDWL